MTILKYLMNRGASFISQSMFRFRPILDVRGFREILATGEDSDLIMRVALLGAWLEEPGEPGLKKQNFPTDNIVRLKNGNNLSAYLLPRLSY